MCTLGNRDVVYSSPIEEGFSRAKVYLSEAVPNQRAFPSPRAVRMVLSFSTFIDKNDGRATLVKDREVVYVKSQLWRKGNVQDPPVRGIEYNCGTMPERCILVVLEDHKAEMGRTVETRDLEIHDRSAREQFGSGPDEFLFHTESVGRYQVEAFW